MGRVGKRTNDLIMQPRTSTRSSTKPKIAVYKNRKGIKRECQKRDKAHSGRILTEEFIRILDRYGVSPDKARQLMSKYDVKKNSSDTFVYHKFLKNVTRNHKMKEIKKNVKISKEDPNESKTFLEDMLDLRRKLVGNWREMQRTFINLDIGKRVKRCLRRPKHKKRQHRIRATEDGDNNFNFTAAAAVAALCKRAPRAPDSRYNITFRGHAASDDGGGFIPGPAAAVAAATVNCGKTLTANKIFTSSCSLHPCGSQGYLSGKAAAAAAFSVASPNRKSHKHKWIRYSSLVPRTAAGPAEKIWQGILSPVAKEQVVKGNSTTVKNCPERMELGHKTVIAEVETGNDTTCGISCKEKANMENLAQEERENVKCFGQQTESLDLKSPASALPLASENSITSLYRLPTLEESAAFRKEKLTEPSHRDGSVMHDDICVFDVDSAPLYRLTDSKIERTEQQQTDVTIPDKSDAENLQLEEVVQLKKYRAVEGMVDNTGNDDTICKQKVIKLKDRSSHKTFSIVSFHSSVPPDNYCDDNVGYFSGAEAAEQVVKTMPVVGGGDLSSHHVVPLMPSISGANQHSPSEATQSLDTISSGEYNGEAGHLLSNAVAKHDASLSSKHGFISGATVAKQVASVSSGRVFQNRDTFSQDQSCIESYHSTFGKYGKLKAEQDEDKMSTLSDNDDCKVADDSDDAMSTASCYDKTAQTTKLIKDCEAHTQGSSTVSRYKLADDTSKQPSSFCSRLSNSTRNDCSKSCPASDSSKDADIVNCNRYSFVDPGAAGDEDCDYSFGFDPSGDYDTHGGYLSGACTARHVASATTPAGTTPPSDYGAEQLRVKKARYNAYCSEDDDEADDENDEMPSGVLFHADDECTDDCPKHSSDVVVTWF